MIEQRLLDDVVTLTEAAGGEIIAIYETDFEVSHKDDDSPLTRADMASHHTLAAGLRELTPDTPLLSEEAEAMDWPTRRTWQRYWLIDPLDGTREFVHRNGQFTVNVALVEGHQVVLGVVCAPVLGTTWYAAAGAGARKKTAAGDHAIHTRRPPSQPPVVVASRSHAGELLDSYLEQIPEHQRVAVGSSLKLCQVAEGSADLYPRLGPTSEWDTAAAQCVVEQAGGAVRVADGSALCYNTKESILNPYFVVAGDPAADWPPIPGASAD